MSKAKTRAEPTEQPFEPSHSRIDYSYSLSDVVYRCENMRLYVKPDGTFSLQTAAASYHFDELKVVADGNTVMMKMDNRVVARVKDPTWDEWDHDVKVQLRRRGVVGKFVR